MLNDKDKKKENFYEQNRRQLKHRGLICEVLVFHAEYVSPKTIDNNKLNVA